MAHEPARIEDALRTDYDRPVDVLRLFVGDFRIAEGDGLPRGVELDYDVDDGAPCGVTVIGFRRNGWHKDLGPLSAMAGEHLGMTPDHVRAAIEANTRD